MKSVALAAALWCAWAGGARADAPAHEITLCQPAEAVLFACDLGTRRVALCRAAGEQAPLVYRYGRPGRVELQHIAPAAMFWRREHLLYGGELIVLGFTRRGWDYQLYARVGRSGGGTSDERVPEFEDGLQVGRSGTEGQRRVCVDGGAGFRAGLDFVQTRP